MSHNIFFCSDHHLGHAAPYTKFTRDDGNFLRYDLADNVEEGDQLMIDRHNAVVKDNDRVYFVGDVAMSHKHLYKLGMMKGRKVLIKGNHDIADLKCYIPFFDDIRGSHQFDGVLITHIPVHPDSLGRWGFNVHGHLHANEVNMWDNTHGNPVNRPDPRYFNVSVERINYTPISLEQVKKFKPT